MSPIPAPQPELRPHILLVEDDHRQRAQLTRLLEEQGYAVEAVGSANQAIRALRLSFDLLVTDIDLDCSMTGLDLANMARVMRPAMPVIILSARAPVPCGRQRVVHLRKPCPSGKLLATVRQFAPID